jgi:hypothetical protein
VLAILSDERQSVGVVRQHLFGDFRDAREHLAHVERLKERRQQAVYRLEPLGSAERPRPARRPGLYSNPCFLMRT